MRSQSIVMAFAFAMAITIVSVPVLGHTLTITSIPPGAAVEINGLRVGTTPYTEKMPNGYFHKSHFLWATRLEYPIIVRLSLDGYTSQTRTISEGPLVLRNGMGRPTGLYYLMKTDHFEIKLDPVGRVFTGEPKISSAKDDPASPDPMLSPEAIAKQSDSAIVRVRTEEGWGTGFFVTSTGLIATNRHVVKGQWNIHVTTHADRRLPAKVVYMDSDKDLALLKADGSNFPHLTLATLHAVQRGEPVVAIGDPGGGMPDTITQGVVSGIGALHRVGSGTWIQTDAAINPGNSGGPLLDGRGHVIGLNAIVQEENASGQRVQGIFYALSAQDLIDVLRRFYPAQKSGTKAIHTGSATVNVSSAPSGADIYVDGNFAGETPSVLHLLAGMHSIEIRDAGKQAWTRQMNVLKDSKITLNPTLAPQK